MLKRILSVTVVMIMLSSLPAMAAIPDFSQCTSAQWTTYIHHAVTLFESDVLTSQPPTIAGSYTNNSYTNPAPMNFIFTRTGGTGISVSAGIDLPWFWVEAGYEKFESRSESDERGAVVSPYHHGWIERSVLYIDKLINLNLGSRFMCYVNGVPVGFIDWFHIENEQEIYRHQWTYVEYYEEPLYGY